MAYAPLWCVHVLANSKLAVVRYWLMMQQAKLSAVLRDTVLCTYLQLCRSLQTQLDAT